MWTLHFQHRKEDKHKPGEPGIQPDGSYITPEGDRLVGEADQATYLRTAQDWIIAPLLKNTPGLAGVDTIGGHVKQFQVIPDLQRLAALGMNLTDLARALEENNVSVGAGVVDRGGEGLAVRSDARIRNVGELRSEEHTSELQSLMRISYAVFCLKKKRNKSYRHRMTRR